MDVRPCAVVTEAHTWTAPTRVYGELLIIAAWAVKVCAWLKLGEAVLPRQLACRGCRWPVIGVKAAP